MRLTLLSRSSALAVLQTGLVQRKLQDRWPAVDVTCATRASAGDRDRQLDLATAATKGLFTADLSQAVVDGEVDAVVHSWKDLPVEGHPRTVIAATLERADPRDVLLVRQRVVAEGPPTITILSSSPRRAWQIQRVATELLPWRVAEVRVAPIRGNIPTRLRKLAAGDGDGLIVAKAALDRLLSADAPAATHGHIRSALDQCRWMVLPLSRCPTAPAQGAVAVEIAASRSDLVQYFDAITHQPTWRAVQQERQILSSFGGGCAEAIGATVIERDYGQITSLRANIAGQETNRWALDGIAPLPPSASVHQIWPRPEERDRVERRAIAVAPSGTSVWVSRAEALPSDWPVTPEWIVWAAGVRTWRRLADRGIWVNGCADGLGDSEAPDADALAGRVIQWRRLTHDRSEDDSALATYSVTPNVPSDVAGRSHFFWTSGSSFRCALSAAPEIRSAWHASGPGRTARTIRETLGGSARHSVWLDYEQWHRHVTS